MTVRGQIHLLQRGILYAAYPNGTRRVRLFGGQETEACDADFFVTLEPGRTRLHLAGLRCTSNSSFTGRRT
jgi:hypothetical protein